EPGAIGERRRGGRDRQAVLRHCEDGERRRKTRSAPSPQGTGRAGPSGLLPRPPEPWGEVPHVLYGRVPWIPSRAPGGDAPQGGPRRAAEEQPRPTGHGRAARYVIRDA